MRFRPCIDLHHGQVKQIVGSTLSLDGSDSAVKTNFASDLGAAYYAGLYRRDGLLGGHVIMLGPGNEEAALAALRAFPGGLQVGGGITISNAQRYLDAGASHVIVTSHVFSNGRVDFDRLGALVRLVGKERLVLDLSCRTKQGGEAGQYWVVTDRWQKYTDFLVTRDNLVRLSEFCAEFLVHGVDVEGMRVGVMEDLVEKLGQWSPIPVTYAGGARSLEDLELVERLGRGRVDLTVGSALDVFGGDLAYDTVVKWHYAHLAPAALSGIEDRALRRKVASARAALAAQLAAQAAHAAFRDELDA
jgi:phosphoribosylformimino-5-aminoimidazole carboxamide ribotide isomerase